MKHNETAKDMAIGIENTAAHMILQSTVLQYQARGHTPQHNATISPTPSSSLSSGDADTIASTDIADRIDLSQEAIATIKKGRGIPAQQDLNSLGKHLQQIQDDLGDLESLLHNAADDFRNAIVKGIETQVQHLEHIGQEIGLITDHNADISVEANTLSDKSAALPQHAIADIYKDPIGALQAKYLPPYKEAGLQIKQLVKEFESRFSDEEQFPPSIFNQIKRLVSSAMNAENNFKTAR